MKIPASKKKLSINFKYMQVQGKGKSKTSCDQALHKSKMLHRYLQFRDEKINQSNLISWALPSCTPPPGS